MPSVCVPMAELLWPLSSRYSLPVYPPVKKPQEGLASVWFLLFTPLEPRSPCAARRGEAVEAGQAARGFNVRFKTHPHSAFGRDLQCLIIIKHINDIPNGPTAPCSVWDVLEGFTVLLLIRLFNYAIHCYPQQVAISLITCFTCVSPARNFTEDALLEPPREGHPKLPPPC